MSQELSPSRTRDSLRFLTIAELSKSDFALAQNFDGFSRGLTFEEFETERESLVMSYHWAGVRAPRQRVPFAAFQAWRRLTGAPLDTDGLDEFAAHWRYRRARPAAPVLGRLGEPGKPEVHSVEAHRAQVVVISPALFARWCDSVLALSPSTGPDLNAYARHVVDCCLGNGAPARAWARRLA